MFEYIFTFVVKHSNRKSTVLDGKTLNLNLIKCILSQYQYFIAIPIWPYSKWSPYHCSMLYSFYMSTVNQWRYSSWFCCRFITFPSSFCCFLLRIMVVLDRTLLSFQIIHEECWYHIMFIIGKVQKRIYFQTYFAHIGYKT